MPIIIVRGKFPKRLFCSHTHELKIIDLGETYRYQSICTKCGNGEYVIYKYPKGE